MRLLVTTIAVVAVAMAAPAFGATLTVTNNSGDKNVADSLPYHINNAGEGDTIVFDGDYTITDWGNSRVFVTVDNVTVDGEDNTIIIDQSAKAEHGSTTLKGSGTIVVGEASDVGGADNSGKGDGFTVRNIDFVACDSYFIDYTDVADCEISNCTWTQPALKNTSIGYSGGTTFVRFRGLVDGAMRNFTFQDNVLDGTPHESSLSDLSHAIEGRGTINPADNNREGPRITNLIIRNCEFKNMSSVVKSRSRNGVTDRVKNFTSVGAYSIDGVTVEDCYFTQNGNTQWSLFDFVEAVNDFTVQGCVFGEDSQGQAPANKQGSAILLWGSARNVLIGGQAEGEGNVFKNMACAVGVVEFAADADDADLNHNIKVRGNEIYGCYSGGDTTWVSDDSGAFIPGLAGPASTAFPGDRALYLVSNADEWVPAPWGSDEDDGTDDFDPATHLMPEPPDITSAMDVGKAYTITGTALPGAEVDLYVSEHATVGAVAADGLFDDLGNVRNEVAVAEHENSPQLQEYLGTATADGNGDWSLVPAADMSGYAGWWIAAVQTDMSTDGNTSNITLEAPRVGTADDWDGDGLSNDFEGMGGLDPNDAWGDNGGSGDPDEDGYTNAEEAAVTDGFSDPMDPNSTPAHPTQMPAAGLLGLAGLAVTVAAATARQRR